MVLALTWPMMAWKTSSIVSSLNGRDASSASVMLAMCPAHLLTWGSVCGQVLKVLLWREASEV